MLCVDSIMKRLRGKSPVVSSDEDRTTDSNESYSPRQEHEEVQTKRLDKENGKEGSTPLCL